MFQWYCYVLKTKTFKVIYVFEKIHFKTNDKKIS